MTTLEESNSQTIHHYLSEAIPKKLHIGCGSHLLPGWLNSDYFPQHSEVIQVDATGRYPFDDDTFDYIFNEHIIEHLSFDKGQQMLREHWRVLKNNGKIRISTPDLKFLVTVFSAPDTELHLAYMKWATRNFIRDAPCVHSTFVINNFMRAWGHQFIYDEAVLRLALERAEFSVIMRCTLSLSDDPELRDLENKGRMPDGFLKLESLVLEGTKHGPTS
jgi:predicted SAM-dependent methyltransferase